MRKRPIETGVRGAEEKEKEKHNPKRSLSEKLVYELKRFLLIAVYLWILLTLFVLQEHIVLSREGMTYYFTPFGFAIINALALGKVVLVAEDLHFATRLDDWPLIYPTLFKSAAFGVICILFYILEKMLVGLWRGEALAGSLPPIVQRGAIGVVLAATTLSIQLIPLFAVRELGRAMDCRELRSLFLTRRSGPR